MHNICNTIYFCVATTSNDATINTSDPGNTTNETSLRRGTYINYKRHCINHYCVLPFVLLWDMFKHQIHKSTIYSDLCWLSFLLRSLWLLYNFWQANWIYIDYVIHSLVPKLPTDIIESIWVHFSILKTALTSLTSCQILIFHISGIFYLSIDSSDVTCMSQIVPDSGDSLSPLVEYQQ